MSLAVWSVKKYICMCMKTKKECGHFKVKILCIYVVIFYAQVKKFAQFLGITVNMLVKIVRKKSPKRGYTLNLVREHKGRCKL